MKAIEPGVIACSISEVLAAFVVALTLVLHQHQSRTRRRTRSTTNLLDCAKADDPGSRENGEKRDTARSLYPVESETARDHHETCIS